MANEKVLVGTKDNFDAILNTEKPVLVDFWATWCGPCRMVGPFIDQLAEEYDGKAVIVKVNVDDEPELAQRYRVATIPNLIVLKNGDIVEQSAGARPKALIAKMIEAAL